VRGSERESAAGDSNVGRGGKLRERRTDSLIEVVRGHGGVFSLIEKKRSKVESRRKEGRKEGRGRGGERIESNR